MLSFGCSKNEFMSAPADLPQQGTLVCWIRSTLRGRQGYQGQSPWLVSFGSNSLIICNRFAITSALLLVIPVMLWSGQARLATSPAATGSIAATKTTGVWPAASLAGNTDGVPEATITSTLRRTNSAAASGICATLSAKPYSM